MRLITKSIFGLIIMGLLSGCSCRTKVADSSRAMFGGHEERGISAPEAATLSTIYYAFDRSDLSESSKATLRRNTDWLKSNSSADVRIEGHADERGTNEYNMALGQRRAQSAASYLRSLGIEARRISTISFGEERPTHTAKNEEAWAQNRRVEFRIQALGDQSL